MEIKLIRKQITENRTYLRFCRKTRFGSLKNGTQTKDSIKVFQLNWIEIGIFSSGSVQNENFLKNRSFRQFISVSFLKYGKVPSVLFTLNVSRDLSVRRCI